MKLILFRFSMNTFIYYIQDSPSSQNQRDLKLYICMKFIPTYKEIAPELNISILDVNIHRYSFSKRLAFFVWQKPGRVHRTVLNF